MLLLSLNLQAQSAPAAPGHGFEMVSGSRKSVYQRMFERRAHKQVRPEKPAARKRARVIEVEAAKAVLADAGEPELRKLMRKWLAQKPALPSDADPYEVFIDQVARRLRQMDEDEEAVLLLL